MLNLSPHDGMSQHLIIRTPGSWLPTSMTQCWPVVCPLVSTTDGTGATAGWLGMIIYVIYVILIHLKFINSYFFGSPAQRQDPAIRIQSSALSRSVSSSEIQEVSIVMVKSPIAGWFVMENPMNIWMIWGEPPYLFSIYNYIYPPVN